MHTWLSLDVAVADVIHERQHAAAADRSGRQQLAAVRAAAVRAANRTCQRRRSGPRHHAARALYWLAAQLDPALARERRLRVAPSSH